MRIGYITISNGAKPAVPKLGAAAPWCAARLFQGCRESCYICRGSPRTWCLVSSLLNTSKFYNGKILSGRFACKTIT